MNQNSKFIDVVMLGDVFSAKLINEVICENCMIVQVAPLIFKLINLDTGNRIKDMEIHLTDNYFVTFEALKLNNIEVVTIIKRSKIKLYNEIIKDLNPAPKLDWKESQLFCGFYYGNESKGMLIVNTDISNDYYAKYLKPSGIIFFKNFNGLEEAKRYMEELWHLDNK